MNPKWRRFAPLGLYLALLAGLAAIGFYVVQREWNLALQICLALVVIGLAVFAVLDPGKVRHALTGRQARYGSNALVVTLAVLGILGVITYVAYKNDKRWDLTEDQTNSLAPETLAALKKLAEPVSVEAYYTSRSSTDSTRLLLENYVRNSDGKFSFEFIDPEADPIAAQNAGITQDGTILLKMGERKQQVTFADEQRLTSALVKLISGETKIVYFLTGHGEKSPDDSGETSYSTAKTKLQAKNYSVKMLNLLTDSAIPEDADALIIAGPTDPILAGEMELIAAYLDNGGAAIIMEEPTVLTKMGGSVDVVTDYLSQAWGIKLGNDIILDPNGQQLVQQALIAVGGAFASHAIVPAELQSQIFLFQGARSVGVSESTGSSTQVEVIKTGDQAWAETDLAALNEGTINPDEGVDIIGSVPIVVTGMNTATNGRVVVVGDSDFASNTFQAAYGNPDLFINMVDWVVGQESLIDLTPKSTTTRTLNLPAVPYFTGFMYLIAIVLIPGAILVAGIVVFIRRRRKG
jgi:ABC-type uncharacterized transport system involved in gliding motility auxiliary subunit